MPLWVKYMSMTGLGSTGFLERPQPDEVLKLG